MFPHGTHGPARLPVSLRLALVAAGVVALAALWRIDPSRATFLPRCPLFVFGGVYCPGCGITRALHHLLHGRLLEALRFNPLAILSLGLLMALWRSPRLRTHPRTPPVLFVVVIAYFVLRNVPIYPCTLLAPHGVPAPAFSKAATNLRGG